MSVCLFLSAFIFLLSLLSAKHWKLSLLLASPSESTPLSPPSPHTTTPMPLLGSIRTSRTGDRIHFYQTVCGCGKSDHRAVGCYIAPQDSEWPHHECSSAARLQLTVDGPLKVQQHWQKSAFLSQTLSALNTQLTSAKPHHCTRLGLL